MWEMTKTFEDVSAFEIIDEFGQFHTVILHFAEGGQKALPHIRQMNLINIGTGEDTRNGRGKMYDFTPGVRNLVLIRERIPDTFLSFIPRRRLMTRNYYRNSYPNEPSDTDSQTKAARGRGI